MDLGVLGFQEYLMAQKQIKKNFDVSEDNFSEKVEGFFSSDSDN